MVILSLKNCRFPYCGGGDAVVVLGIDLLQVRRLASSIGCRSGSVACDLCTPATNVAWGSPHGRMFTRMMVNLGL